MLGLCVHELRDSSNPGRKVRTVSIIVILKDFELFKQAKVISSTIGILQLTPFIILG
jgi:hypothetical protein